MELASKPFPQMSVVLVTPDTYHTIQNTVEHLRVQTVAEQLELVVVAPSGVTFNFDAIDTAPFHQIRLIKMDEITSTGRAIAAGIRAATAPVVAYAEEHSYPAPEWAEALIKAHRHSWAVVGVAMANANPTNLISWASLYTDFGPWVEPVAAGVISQLPWHHAAYKRAVLVEYDSELNSLFETEGILHTQLQAKGCRLYLEPTARTYHVNFTLLSSYLRAEFHGARMFAANRARTSNWSVFRRLWYIGRVPFIPFVRLNRILHHISRSGRKRELLPRILPALIMGLAADAFGQLTGYVLGAGDAAQQRVSFELHRYQHVTEQDRINMNAFATVKKGYG